MSIYILKDDRKRKTVKENAEIERNSITHLIKDLATRQEKVDLIAERNPLHYMFGEYLRVRKYNESYEDFINRNYIGRTKWKRLNKPQQPCTQTNPMCHSHTHNK